MKLQNTEDNLRIVKLQFSALQGRATGDSVCNPTYCLRLDPNDCTMLLQSMGIGDFLDCQ